MTRYRLTYKQLEEIYQHNTWGKHEPKLMLVSSDTFAEIRAWLKSFGQLYPHPEGGIWFNAASIHPAEHVPDGIVIYVGGAHILKLDKEPDAD